MSSGTGFQIAFLVLVVEFFSTLLASGATRSMGWPTEALDPLGQVISLSLAAMILFGIAPLRRFCLDAVRKQIPGGRSAELLVVGLAKSAIPFAVVGALAGWEFVAGKPERIAAHLPAIDPVEAWTWTLSPIGLARMVILSWLAGPLLEEFVFRGILYRAWERQWGWVASMILTSTCFGLAHPTHIASAFLGSIVYVCVLRRTGTLRAPILVHVLFNVLLSWPLLGQALPTSPVGMPFRLSAWTLPLACLAFVLVALPAYVWMSRGSTLADGPRMAGAS